MNQLMLACALFVATHFLLSGPLRSLLAGQMGEAGFRIAYSLVSLGQFAWIVIAFRAAPSTGPASSPSGPAMAGANAAMLVACVLLAGSMVRNPALPSANAKRLAAQAPKGVFAITRHPMMWSFAIWAAVHFLIWPTPENRVLTAAMFILALGGAAHQDIKKARLMGASWRGWAAQTSFFPLAGQLARRARWADAWPGVAVVAIGIIMWLALMWAHGPAGARIAIGPFA